MTLTRLARLSRLAAVALPLVLVWTPAAAATGPALTVDGRPLAGAVTAPSFTVASADLGSSVRAKFRLDGVYLGTDATLPFTWPVSATAGTHELEVRVYDEAGEQGRTAARFTVERTTTATPTPAPAPAPSTPAPAPAPGTRALTADGRPLAGATVASGVTVTAPDLGGTVKAKFRLDGAYLGTAVTLPLTWPAHAAPGAHQLEVRLYDAAGAEQGRVVADFTVAGSSSTPQPAPAPAPAPTPTPSPAPAPVRTVTVRDGAGLAAALAAATPGTTIQLADGVYTAEQQLTVGTSCTAAAPCALRGGRGAVLDGAGLSGHYGLHVKDADHWTVAGVTVRNASKGIVVDGSDRVVIDGVEVTQIGAEGIHLRAFSSDGVVRGSLVHHVGLDKPQFGEGIYIGSATSNWGTYSGGRPDASDRNVITGNRIWATGAESVDIKEGTTGGVLSGNTFDGAGMAGENSADSWVDVKGNDWLISRNTGTNALLDGFQTHVLVSGWGRRNVFTGNTATVRAAGYGFRFQDAATTGNVLRCDNTVTEAGLGSANQRCA
ncbi:right-handed parallel beta-helix repeat-containing protein [Cellulomonas aerilata]|nr:right-handed parallel beta-helix repeat-containing protein [Cellulomonas aerilata]